MEKRKPLTELKSTKEELEEVIKRASRIVRTFPKWRDPRRASQEPERKQHTMPQFQCNCRVVEAIRFDHKKDGFTKIRDFLHDVEHWVVPMSMCIKTTVSFRNKGTYDVKDVEDGDWIIKIEDGSFIPLKDSIFLQLFSEVSG